MEIYIQFDKFCKFVPGLDFTDMLCEKTGDNLDYAAASFIESYYKNAVENNIDEDN